MRILTWEDLNLEDLAFIRIKVAEHTWSPQHITHYSGTGRIDNMLFYVISGVRRYEIPGRKTPLEVHTGDLMFMPTGCCYDSYVLNREGSSGVNINFTILDGNGEVCCIGKEAVLLRRGIGDDLEQLLQRIRSSSLQHGSRLKVKELMMYLLARLCDDKTLQVPEEIRPAVRYMKEHLESPITISQMARLCHMSDRTFTRHFVQALGDTPSGWHRNIRLMKGRELLQGGLYTVEQTAQTVGFYDTAHFCRAYAAYFGETPIVARGERGRQRFGG